MCFLGNICCWLSTVAFIKSMWPYCNAYLFYPREKVLIFPKRHYACAIKKAIVGKTVSLRDNECGVCMSFTRSGRGDMERTSREALCVCH